MKPSLARPRGRAPRLFQLVLCACALAVIQGTSPVRAQVVPSDVPEALKPWVGWVLRSSQGGPDERCVLIGELRTCVFPSALDLDVSKTGASFQLRVTLDRRGPVALPGSAEHFPLEVRAANKPVPVLDVDGVPSVHLEPGSHTLSGRFRFATPPDALQLPSSLATLSLSVDGVRVPFPKRDEGGLLWLKQSGAGAEEERLSLSVHRKLEDGVPLKLTTRVLVSAAGKAREVTLPNVLVAGTRPIELRAGLPAELTAQGTLRMQVQAGEHQLEIVAIRETGAGEFRAPETHEPWPEREVWVFRSDERLRHVEIKGPAQIDPARTDLAGDWRDLPTYVMPPKQALQLELRRRGEPEPPPNQLALQRTLWLDLDGDGYTVRDQFSGKLQRDFRLDLLAGVLGRAVDGGHDELVTVHAKRTGVELRRREIALQTEWRMEHGRGDLPAVGYSEHADSLLTTLHLPPGFMLLGAEGVDQLHGTWIDSWDLFDFFFVLLLALAVGKLAGPVFGVCALIALVLTHQEPDAPAVAWVFLLAFTGLVLAVKRGRYAKLLRIGWMAALVCLLLVMLPFSVLQVRKALYPHLDAGGAQLDAGSWSLSMPGTASEPAVDAVRDEPEAAPATPAPEEVAQKAEGAAYDQSASMLREAAGGGGLGSLGVSGVGVKTAPARGRGDYEARSDWLSSSKNDVDPNAVVQTGPGLPAWQFRQFTLRWSGPVQKDQRIQLWIAPPFVSRLWSIASVLFCGLLLFALARAARRAGPVQPASEPPPAAGAALLLLALGWPHAAQAQSLPPPELLNELRDRILQPPACAPHCLSVASLELRVDASRLVLRAEVHAQATAAYQAPGPLESWAPDSVRVNGKDALAAVRSEDGFLHVRLEQGVHQVELSGPVPRTQAFTLALGTPPHHVSAEHKGFIVDGLRDDGRAEGSLSLRREVGTSGNDETTTQSLVQWFEVRRELELGIRFRVRTTVTRLGPASESALLRLPLLPGESVSEAGLVAERDAVVLELRRGESDTTFASTLAPVPSLTLRAAQPATAAGPLAQPFSEVWVVAPSSLYRPRFEGIAPLAHVSANGAYRPEYRPFPGESLTIHAARLSGAEGASITADSATASFTPGRRMERASLRLRIRTSRGATEHLTLPADAQLTSLAVDGVARPSRVKDGKLELLLDPGAHDVIVELQRAVGMEFVYRPLQLSSDVPLTNVTTEVHMPEGRWLLWARGPAWGPAVLFWGYLIVVLLCGALLGRLSLSPLKTHQWCLLGLGLTQVEAPVALIVVGWLFALAYRERHPASHPTVFNCVQVLLVGLSVLALVCLGYAVHRGLVVQPNMQVEGMGSIDPLLRWFLDRTHGDLPDVTIWSAPLWTYKAIMLLWALWLAGSILRWLRWGLAALRSGGGFRTPRTPGGGGPNDGSRARGRATNPRVALGDVEAAEAELKRKRTEPPTGDGGVGPEGAGVP
jgi:hypothetical protein